ncbi:MAG: hypothetical protein AAFN93_24015 [Bacteroidota bacterium]
MLQQNKLAIIVFGAVLAITLSVSPANSKTAQANYQVFSDSNLIATDRQNTQNTKETSDCAEDEQLMVIAEGPDQDKKVCCKKGKTFWEWVLGQEGSIAKCDLLSSE